MYRPKGGQAVMVPHKINTLFYRTLISINEKKKSGMAILRRDQGATAVEYALLVGLIAAAIILAVVFLGGTIRNIFTKVGSTISSNS
jgi:pilus assembly protein Flp/PilA